MSQAARIRTEKVDGDDEQSAKLMTKIALKIVEGVTDGTEGELEP
jgi:hypothetical protein